MPTIHNDWLEAYIEYSAACCESPIIFHIWVAMWVLSCCVQRRVHIPLHGKEEYPNLFVVIVGPSARVQKSTVGEVGVTLLNHLNDLTLMQDRVTRAYLHSYLADASSHGGDSSVAIFTPEMRTAFNEMTLKEGIMELLTRAHDCPTTLEYRLQSSGLQSATNVWLSMLCCSTPQWLTVGLDRDEAGGGFAGRCIFVYGDTPHRRLPYGEELPQRSRTARRRVVERMLQIEQMRGPCRLAPGAGVLWNAFREEIDRTAGEQDSRVQPYRDRMHAHALKIACLLSLSRRNDMQITEQDMVNAIDMLQDTEQHVLRSLSTVSLSKPNLLGDTVLQILREHGGVATRSDIIRLMYNRRVGMTGVEADGIMNMLEEAGKILRHMRQVSPGAKMQTIYYLPESAPEVIRKQQEIQRRIQQSE